MSKSKKPRTGFKLVIHSIFWTLILALLVHIGFAVWPIPEFRGGKALQSVLNDDWARLEPLMSERFINLVKISFDWVYKVFFVFTGLDYLVSNALSKEEAEGLGSEGMRSLVLQAWRFIIEPFYFSLQILVLRTAALFSLFPLFLAAGLVGFINGYVGRYLRRTSGAKESGFIYHRSKVWLWLAFWGIWPIYLIPPTSMNLSLLLIPFLITNLCLTWLVTHWFKKQL